jgi:hypothetical protein
MKRILGRAAAAVGSLALVGGVIAATALPASATVPNGSFGAAGTGPLTFGPVAPASVGSGPALASNANAGDLLATGVIKDTATTSSATSKVSDVVVNLSGLSKLKANGVTSACYQNSFGTAVGDTDISAGTVVTIATVGYPNPQTVVLPADPAPNTTIDINNVADIVLNQQTPSGTALTVNAMYITLDNSAQTLTIGSSTCNSILT